MTFVTLHRILTEVSAKPDAILQIDFHSKLLAHLKHSIHLFYLLFGLLLINCKTEPKRSIQKTETKDIIAVSYAKGFSLEKNALGFTVLTVNSPWPNSEAPFRYALVPKETAATITLNKEEYDAIVMVPVQNLVVTSTTHIPAIEALGVTDFLIGFPDTKYISSVNTRERIDSGQIKELGNNETLNTELLIELNPELVIGFGIDSQNSAYETIERANIPVVYNGDWTEQTPLGKAEWIKFFAPFFEKEELASKIFTQIETDYQETKKLALTAKSTPKVISGAMYKDMWYLPGGKSWPAQFIADANADYLWKNTDETGSLSLSWENVLETGQNADFWIGPAQFTSYESMSSLSKHYTQFEAFKNKQIFTFANTKGATGGLLYYELAPQRPDLVLKDLIHILHPELLPNHKSFFFTALK